ncbi:hypothetical protein OH799_06870 [Nocardia sp. NBC_00881]|uniref:hypothetical protein n=1 Tax=Nocardia sp. NBC_00881 TaxID=2975995 RepID=UPI00386997FC|nr:hypothetical protein OH799_06870 [Nocardia sp. NBC_00881]
MDAAWIVYLEQDKGNSYAAAVMVLHCRGPRGRIGQVPQTASRGLAGPIIAVSGSTSNRGRLLESK